MALSVALGVLGCGTTRPPTSPEPSPGVTPHQPRTAPSARADEAREPSWTEGAVLYGVVPGLFGAPPLRAVTERIDELAELGIDALWLSPVTATTDPDDYGYATTDYLRVREDFGTKEDLQRLVERAHAHDMRVLMDFVPNHTSEQHPWFHDPSRVDWYERDADGHATHYFDWSHLPNLDYGNAEVVTTMTSAFSHWMRGYGIDGFRVDAAWGIRERNPEVWPRIVDDLRAVDADVFMLAEASARDAWWFRQGFDAAYDWTDEVGRWAWHDVFEDVETIGPRLDAAVAAAPAPHRVARFLNNNDTGERFVTRYGAPMQRVAAAMLLTLPGLPVVFTGDEVGAEFHPYEAQAPLSWSDPHELLPWYRRLVHLRESLPGLRGAAWTRVEVEPASAWAYVRHADDGSDPALVVLNFGPACNVSVRLPSAPAGLVREAFVHDALRQTEVRIDWRSDREASIVMPETSAAILVTPRPES